MAQQVQKSIRKGFVWLTILALMMPLAAGAATFSAQEEILTIDEEIPDDLFAAARVIEIQKSVGSDVVAAAQTITTAAQVDGDVMAFAETIEIGGPVTDDVFAAGASIRIKEDVASDVFLVGEEVIIEPGVAIGQDVYVASQSAVIRGHVNGTVRAAGKVTIASGAVVEGDLLTWGTERPTIEEGAVVQGTTRHVEARTGAERSTRVILAGWVRSVLALFVVALLILYVARNFTGNVLTTLREKPLQSVGVGVLWIILVGPVTLVLLITTVGLPLAALAVLKTITSLIIAAGLSAIAIGSWLIDRVARQKSGGEQKPLLSWQHALLGAVVYEAIQLAGVFGWLLTFVLVLLMLGALAITAWRMLRKTERQRQNVHA